MKHVRIAALSGAALALTLAVAVAPASAATTTPAASPACCGLDGQIWNAGPTSLGIVGTWTNPPHFSFTIAPNHWSSERQADVDGYYIGPGWAAFEYSCKALVGCPEWNFEGYRAAGYHAISGGFVRVKVITFRVTKAKTTGVNPPL